MENVSIITLQKINTKEIKKIDNLLELKNFLNNIKDESLDDWNLSFINRKQTSKKNGNNEGTLYYSEALEKWVGQFWNKSTNKRITLTQRKNETVKEFKNRYYKSKEQMKDGTYIEKSKETIISLAETYIKQKHLDGDTSKRSYRRDIETINGIKKTCSDFCNIPIQSVTIKHIEKAKEEIKNYSNSEIKKIWHLLNKVFSIASSPSRKILIYNLMNDENLKKPISNKKTKKVKPLTSEELKKLNKVLDTTERNHKYRNIIKMQSISGMRIGEVLSRSVHDYDKENQLFYICNTLTQDENYHVIWSEHTKNYNKRTGVDEGERYLPLKNKLFSELISIIEEQKSKGINNSYNLLFWNYKNQKFISPNEVNSWLSRINKKYNICEGSLSTHRLRHTALTYWNELGLPLRVIQYFAGHVEGSSVTNRNYIDVSLEFSTEALNKIFS